MRSGGGYYDLHDIIAGETAIPCTLLTQVNSCGRALDQSSDHANLKSGHSLELPLWLATDVAARHMVSVRSAKSSCTMLGCCLSGIRAAQEPWVHTSACCCKAVMSALLLCDDNKSFVNNMLLAEVLCKSQSQVHCPCRLPKCYGKKMREKMRAGPGCEDLKMRCPYFYSVAMDLQAFIYNDDALAPFVEKTFRDRYQVS